MWAPRTEIIQALLDAPDQHARRAVLERHRPAVFADIRQSLSLVDHPGLLVLAERGQSALSAAEAGHWEASLALATNVIEAAYKHMLHKRLWGSYREAINEAIGKPKGSPNAHQVLSGAFTARPDQPSRAFDYVPWLVLAGLQRAFAWAAPSHYNRHAVTHDAHKSDAYREDFILPSLLIMLAMLREIETQLPDPDEEEAESTMEA